MKKHIGVLLSGRGSNFDALAASVDAGRIPNADISIVISNRDNAPGIEKARARGIDARVIPSKGLEREAYDRQVVAALREKKHRLVCLAGYMRLLSPYFVKEFPQRILNIHPSLLPAFPGLEPHRQALEHGAKVLRLHRALRGRKSRCRPDHHAGGSADRGRPTRPKRWPRES